MSWQDQAPQIAKDLRHLAEFLGDLGMRAVCDQWGRNRAVTSVDEIPVASADDVEAAVAADPRTVWVTGGGIWFGTPAMEVIRRTLTPGRLYAIVIRSGTSGVYYGTHLYAYDGTVEAVKTFV